MKTRDDILKENPIETFLTKRGIKLHGAGTQRTASRCAAVKHKDEHLCVSVNCEIGLWHCNDCGTGGTVIDWLMAERNESAGAVINSFIEKSSPSPSGKPRIVATYDYEDESGQLIYQVVRTEPKSFRQRQPDANGGWIWSMDGVTRILFNLAEVLRSKEVIVAEGEKDCGNLSSIGRVATCNVGGAGKWLPAYAERLKGKDIIVIPDNDDLGRKHANEVVASLDGKANSVKLVILPDPYKDASDYIRSFPDLEQAKREFSALCDRTAHTIKPLAIYTVEEMERIYREHTKRPQAERFDPGKWLPILGQSIKPMVPGEVMLVLADTGTGKTLILQELLRAASPNPSLLFELELPMALLFERFVQMEVGCYRSDVQDEYRDNDVPLWKNYKGLHHLMVCPEAGLSIGDIENLIVRSELKFGRRPLVVALDYAGLINRQGSRSRYEALSNIAEEVKVMAKRTGTVVLMASQIARPDKKESLTIGLHDAKDSGALENSAGVVIGAWRPEKGRIILKILKNTSGQSGDEFEADFDGGKMRITNGRKK